MSFNISQRGKKNTYESFDCTISLKCEKVNEVQEKKKKKKTMEKQLQVSPRFHSYLQVFHDQIKTYPVSLVFVVNTFTTFPWPSSSIHPSTLVFPNLKACTRLCTDLYTHTHTHSCFIHTQITQILHTHLQTLVPTLTRSHRTTFNPSCLHNQVVTASKRRSLKRQSCFSATLSLSRVKQAFCWRKLIISQTSKKGLWKVFWCFKTGCVLSLSKIDDFCRLKCLTENVVPNWTSPFTCGGTVRCLPTLKRLVVPVLIINQTPCYRYVNQTLSFRLMWAILDHFESFKTMARCKSAFR